MDCALVRTGISAALDGEEVPLSTAAIHQHLARCAACREFQAGALALHRQVRLHAAAPVPDLTDRIVESIGDPPVESGAVPALRLAVALIGLVQLGLSLPALVLGSDAGLPVHATRHLGSFGVALAVGLLSARGSRPASRGCCPSPRCSSPASSTRRCWT